MSNFLSAEQLCLTALFFQLRAATAADLAGSAPTAVVVVTPPTPHPAFPRLFET